MQRKWATLSVEQAVEVEVHQFAMDSHIAAVTLEADFQAKKK